MATHWVKKTLMFLVTAVAVGEAAGITIGVWLS